MITSTEFQRMNEDYMKEQLIRRHKLKKIWRSFLILSILLILLSILIFPHQFSSSEFAWITPTYGGMAFVITLIGFTASTRYNSEKPFFESLYADLFQKINSYEGLFLQYTAYDKDIEKFNKKGGLFTKYSTVKVKRHVTGDTEEHHNFNIYDCTMTTSSGKSQQVHFNGVYFVLSYQLNTSIQVRTHGSPKLEKTKFIKLDGYQDLRVYKEPEKEMMNIDNECINFVKNLTYNENYKKVAFSVVDGEIHLAIMFKKHPARKLKVITQDSITEVMKYFLSEYKTINDIASISVY